MENIFNNPAQKSTAGFISKDNIIYQVEHPGFVTTTKVHHGYLSINEYLKEKGDNRQVVNFGGRLGAYLIPLKKG